MLSILKFGCANPCNCQQCWSSGVQILVIVSNCFRFAHSVEASWRLGGSEAQRHGCKALGPSGKLLGEGECKHMCRSFKSLSLKLHFLLPGGCREALGCSWGKGNAKRCVKHFKILVLRLYLCSQEPIRSLPGASQERKYNFNTRMLR